MMNDALTGKGIEMLRLDRDGFKVEVTWEPADVALYEPPDAEELNTRQLEGTRCVLREAQENGDDHEWCNIQIYAESPTGGKGYESLPPMAFRYEDDILVSETVMRRIRLAIEAAKADDAATAELEASGKILTNAVVNKMDKSGIYFKHDPHPFHGGTVTVLSGWNRPKNVKLGDTTVAYS